MMSRRRNRRGPRSIVPALIVLIAATCTAIITSVVSLYLIGFLPLT